MTVVSTTVAPYVRGSGVTFRECPCPPFYQKQDPRILSSVVSVYAVTGRKRCSQQKLIRGYRVRVTKNY